MLLCAVCSLVYRDAIKIDLLPRRGTIVLQGSAGLRRRAGLNLRAISAAELLPANEVSSMRMCDAVCVCAYEDEVWGGMGSGSRLAARCK